MGIGDVSARLRQAAAGESSVFWWVRACEALDHARESASTRSGMAWESLTTSLGQVRREVSCAAGDPEALPSTRTKLMAIADRLDAAAK